MWNLSSCGSSNRLLPWTPGSCVLSGANSVAKGRHCHVAGVLGIVGDQRNFDSNPRLQGPLLLTWITRHWCIITSIIKCVVKLLIHSQASTVEPAVTRKLALWQPSTFSVTVREGANFISNCRLRCAIIWTINTEVISVIWSTVFRPSYNISVVHVLGKGAEMHWTKSRNILYPNGLFGKAGCNSFFFSVRLCSLELLEIAVNCPLFWKAKFACYGIHAVSPYKINTIDVN